VRSKPGTAVILLVDDEEIDRRAVSNVLRAQGHSVFEAVSYSDAMAVFDLNRYAVQLLIADVCLPDGNGCALAIAMRKQKPDLKVLFISFHIGAEICRQYGLDVGDLHYLNKPLIANELGKRVRTLLTSRQRFPRLIAPTKTFSA
jgi:two-component system, cell cycle sensor histidine kinase and response regulator CckA